MPQAPEVMLQAISINRQKTAMSENQMHRSNKQKTASLEL